MIPSLLSSSFFAYYFPSLSDLRCFSSILPFRDFDCLGVGGETIGGEKTRFAISKL